MVREATDSSISFKTTNKNSKPLRNDELTIDNHNLRYLRKNFKYHSNPSNGAKLNTARVYFKMLLSENSSKWLSDTLIELGNKKANTSSGHITDSSNGRLERSDQKKTTMKNTSAYTKKLLKFRKTFFEARQHQQETLNRVHDARVNTAVASSSFFNTRDNDPLPEDFSKCELVRALKNCSCSSSFDNDQIHPKMLQKVGARFIEIILRHFNMCIRKIIWTWNTSRMIFIKKSTKRAYDVPSCFRTLSIAFHPTQEKFFSE